MQLTKNKKITKIMTVQKVMMIKKMNHLVNPPLQHSHLLLQLKDLIILANNLVD